MKKTLTIFCILLSSACGSEETADDPYFPLKELGPAELQLSVGESGGVLALGDDSVFVEFPEGAFASETLVTLRRNECDAKHLSLRVGTCGYDVEFSGELQGRYDVNLEVENARCVLTDSVHGLSCLEDSETGSTATTASTSLQREFAALVSQNLPADGCVDPVFNHCGGDIIGEWEFVRSCGTLSQLANIEFSEPDRYSSCSQDDWYEGYPFEVRSNLYILPEANEGYDGYWQTEMSVRVYKHSVVTLQCLSTSNESCGPDCTNHNGVCECFTEDTTGEGGFGRQWRWDENFDIFLDQDTDRLEYCVKGDSLKVQYPHEDGPFVVVYKRRP